MPEARLDHLGVFSLGDQKSSVGMPQVVEPESSLTDAFDCGSQNLLRKLVRRIGPPDGEVKIKSRSPGGEFRRCSLSRRG